MSLMSPIMLREVLSESTRHERFGAIFYDANKRAIGAAWLSDGCQDGVMINLRQLAKVALEHDAAGMILAHSHPHCADPRPSIRDIEVTRQIHAFFSRLGVPVLDHHIYSARGARVYQFKRDGVSWL